MTCANCMAATEMAWWQGSQDICTDRTEASVLSLVPAWWCLCLSVLCFMLFHGLSQQEHCGSNSVAILTPVPLWGRGGACSVEQRLCVSETHFSILQLLRQAWTKWEGWHKCCKQWLSGAGSEDACWSFPSQALGELEGRELMYCTYKASCFLH